MDIAALSMGMAQARVMNSVGYSVLGKVLDTMQTDGQQLTEMLSGAAPDASMELSVNPHIGGNIDISV